MTLLETLVALVILGLAGVAFLGLFSQSAQLSQETSAWSRAVTRGRNTMAALQAEPSLLRFPPDGRPAAAGSARGADGSAGGDSEAGPVTWTVRPWRTPGVVLVTVRVPLPREGTYRLSRLFSAPDRPGTVP